MFGRKLVCKLCCFDRREERNRNLCCMNIWSITATGNEFNTYKFYCCKLSTTTVQSVIFVHSEW